MNRRARSIPAVVLMVILVASCSGDGLGDVTLPTATRPDATVPDTPDTTGPATTAPATTVPDEAAPDTTVPDATVPDTSVPEGDEEEAESGGVPLWVLAAGGLLLVALVAWLGARGGRRSTSRSPSGAASLPVAAVARQAHVDSRWLYEQLTPTLAGWKGDSEFAARSGTPPAADARQSTWWETQTRLEAARNGLRGIVVAEPNSKTSEYAQNLMVALDSTKAGLDRMTAARLARRYAEAEGTDPVQMGELHAAESRAADDLTMARTRLLRAIDAFAEVV